MKVAMPLNKETKYVILLNVPNKTFLFLKWCVSSVCFSVQTYMQTFGSYMQPSHTEFANISRRSLNFFETEWQHHHQEFQRSLYPRSNTISVISDISSASSDNTSGIGSAENMGTPPALPAKLGRVCTTFITFCIF